MIAILQIVLLQCLAWGVAWGIFELVPLSQAGLLTTAAIVAGLLAAVCLRRSVAVCLHIAMPLLCALALLSAWPPWSWLLAAMLTWAVGAGAFRHRVPLYLSNRRALQQLESLIPHGAHLVDLGAGIGTTLAWLARRRPDLRLSGVELAFLPWLIGRLRFRSCAVDWRRADAFEIDLAKYDVVYAYLSPAPMSALWHKARAELHSDALLISNSFGIEGVPPRSRHPVDDWRRSELFVWRPNSQAMVHE